MSKKHSLISIFILFTTIAFILCGGCGFILYPSSSKAAVKMINTKTISYKNIFVNCNSTQFCEVLKSTITNKTKLLLANSFSNSMNNTFSNPDNTDDAIMVVIIKEPTIIPVIYYGDGPSPFYKYTYQADVSLYLNKHNNNPISVQDYVVTAPTEQLCKEANAYGYDNTYLYITESHVWNHLYQPTADKLVAQLTESAI